MRTKLTTCRIQLCKKWQSHVCKQGEEEPLGISEVTAKEVSGKQFWLQSLDYNSMTSEPFS